MHSLIEKQYELEKGKRYPWIVKNMGRRKLFRLFADMGFKVGCEIGVQYGVNAERMFDEIPGLKLYCVDPFQYQENSVHREFGHRILKGAKEQSRERLKDKNVVWIQTVSEEAVRLVENESLDFVYIDGDHTYEYVMLDIILWSRKVRDGGVISGHDYYYRKDYHARLPLVTAAVWHYTHIHRVAPWYITDRVCKNREPGDRLASWFWVKMPRDRRMRYTRELG